MIKRTDSVSKSRRKPSAEKQRQERLRRRRLTMQSLEDRQLLAADGVVPIVDPAIFAAEIPRNIGTVTAFEYFENEATGTTGENNTPQTADLLPLGTGVGQEDTIDINGSMGIVANNVGRFEVDQDVYAMDLRAGDILDIAVLGTGSNFTVLFENQQIWFGADQNTALVDPADPTLGSDYGAGSPLQQLGNAVGAQVVPEDGRYYLYLSPTDTTINYTAGVRVYRPVTERLPIGVSQYVYLDFDGGIYPSTLFDPTLPASVVRFNSLEQNLGLLGFVNPLPSDIDRVIDFTVEETIQQMATLGVNGTNGDFATTGIPGDFGITILNSRDHADPGLNNPLVTRVFIGAGGELGITDFGVATSLDIGNFNLGEVVIAALEPHAAIPAQYPLAPTATASDAIAQQLAGTITHELAHSFGLRHTDGNNLVESLIDEGSVSLVDYSQGVGPDGIFGSSDDIVPQFNTDVFSPTEAVFFGFQFSAASLSHSLSTGTVGASVTGRVFNDINRDGIGNGDSGLAGVTVFADANENGVRDALDPSAVTLADGSFTLPVASGDVNVIAVAPSSAFSATTPTSQAFVTGSGGTLEFGFTLLSSTAMTGTVFADNNGNGQFDTSEGGVPDIFVYLDLDNDNRPDLGEPSTTSGSDGSYTLNFPGPGTYTIRQVVEAGFIQTSPNAAAGFEHVVTFDGLAFNEFYDFGNLPSRDWGDAPAEYGTLSADGGPSHGIVTGLGLGTEIDREVNGQPTANADGDDNNGDSDEDGVRQISPLGPGDVGTFEITVRNTGGIGGYLQGWFDFNDDGDFADAGEQVFTNRLLAAGTHELDVSVPDDAVIGTTYARFRYSTTQNLGTGGDADDGEVEDYFFTVQNSAELINDDFFTVSRNTQANQFFVLANDFETPQNQLTIGQLGLDGLDGQVSLSTDRRSIFYTPRNNFVGRDAFVYSVLDGNGNPVLDDNGAVVTATVIVNVTFQSAIPIALDDTFEIPQGSSNRALNVLDNDVPSVAGGIRIASVGGGDQGGRVTIDGGGQTLRYTPAPGFSGTEQFQYSISDQLGQTSVATVTVNMLPNSRLDDRVEFVVEILDFENRPLPNVQVGQQFQVRVSVDDLRYDANNPPPFGSPEGVASAFLDLLYTDELVATIDEDDNPDFPFDITFGPLFESSGFSGGSSAIPGILDEVGAVQPISIDNDLNNHAGFTTLFTVVMEAVSPGVAVFTGDPADDLTSETVLVGENVALGPALQRLGRTELTIFPESDNFTSAIDDSFPTGVDSNGNPIVNLTGTAAVLDVLANDNLGTTGIIREFGVTTSPTLGNVVRNDNGTALNFNDDFFQYTPFIGAQGFERFSYVIVTDDGVRSTAEVTMQVGAAAGDVDLVALDFELVDANGNSISSVTSGQRFGVEIYAEDLRTTGQENVFAAFLDVGYNSGLITPSDIDNDNRYDFDVIFGPDFDRASGVGTASRVGLIDEFGSQLSDPEAVVPARNLLATLYFDAAIVSSPTTTAITGGPADAFPFQDTLLAGRDEPVEVQDIRYDLINVQILPGNAPLTNFALPQDVNGDGNVTPLDALTVVNEMAAARAEGERARNNLLYTDVNGDSRTSALDALQVINYLREQRQLSLLNGERLTVNSLSGSDTAQVDGVFAEISGKQVIASVDGPLSSGVGGVALDALEDAGDDEEEDVLSVLADDLFTQWS